MVSVFYLCVSSDLWRGLFYANDWKWDRDVTQGRQTAFVGESQFGTP